MGEGKVVLSETALVFFFVEGNLSLVDTGRNYAVIIFWQNYILLKEIRFVDYLWYEAEISDSGASFAGRFGAKFRVKLKSEYSAY